MAVGPGPMSPLVSVIVPHFNDPDALDHCLAALEAQSLPPEQFEIIVADNGSPQGKDAIAALIRNRARLVIVPERGAGPARNGGVAAARGEFLAFTDCDCLPDRQWLEKGLAALDRYDLAGGRMTVALGHAGPMSGAEAFEAVLAFDNEAYVKQKGFTVTANLFCRRSDFERIGPFRTQLSEDREWCRRGAALGLSLGYAADAVVAHPPRRNWAELKQKFARINSETYAYYRATRRMGRVNWMLRSFVLPLSILPHGLKIMMTPRLHGQRDRLAALAMLVRQRLWRFADAWRLLICGN